MAETKVTKRMVLEAVKAYVEGAGVLAEVDGVQISDTDAINFVDTYIAQLEAKNEKAKERAAAKRAEGDALKERVLGFVTDELQTADAIFAAMGDDDGELTIAKIRARLTQLVKAGSIVKEEIKVEKGKKMAYKLA